MLIIVKIALVGNPNCGKTTLFNRLTASNQYVGNWPGVTVEKKEGYLKGDKDVKIVDLPGIYSLTPYTDEEIVSRNFLFYNKPDIILNIVSGINLERSLYLTLQLLETNIPVVVCITMMDKLEKSGGSLNLNKLEQRFNCRFVAFHNSGSEDNISIVSELVQNFKCGSGFKMPGRVCYSIAFEKYIKSIENIVYDEGKASECGRFEAIRFLENDEEYIKKLNISSNGLANIKCVLEDLRSNLKEDAKSVIISERYSFISRVLPLCVKNVRENFDISDKVDAILLHKLFAIPIFIFLLGFIYCFCINIVGQPISHAIDLFIKGSIGPVLQNFMESVNVSKWVVSLVVDAVLSGVGTVLCFVPQVFMLFLFLSLLEDCGYMSRVAFILDRFFGRFGLAGISVISFLVSSGCGVNGVMATKTIRNENKRFLTMLTTTFIPCSAKLPIVAVICSYVLKGSFLLVFLVYCLCIMVILVVCLILKKFCNFENSGTDFVMELGPYSLPNIKNVFYYAAINVKSFVAKAGSIIFLASILIWFLLNFGVEGGVFKKVSYQYNSLLAVIGRFVAPAFFPLGFANWESAVATISGLFAKENVVNTFGVILKSAKSFGGLNLGEIFRTKCSALAFLMFNLLCAPCVAAISSIYRQTLSIRFTLKILFFQTISAYISAFIVNQICGLIFKELSFSFYSILSFGVLFLLMFLIITPKKYIKY